MLVLYGLGTVVGAGIYAVIGEVAADAGLYTPLAFFIAALVALFSAMSLAELSARYPKSAGEALFVREAFQRRHLSTVVGLLVVISGIVSAATIVNGAVGYVQEIVALDRVVIVVGLTLIFGFVASLGVGVSVGVASTISVIEVLGLLAVIFSGSGVLSRLPDVFSTAPPLTGAILSSGVLGGALVAFYAFIGFEDMVNMAEEVKEPTRIMPKAILTVLGISSIIYVLLALVMVGSMDIEGIRASNAPLAAVFEQTTRLDSRLISLIGILAIVNGGLVQIIMGSRVIYGMTRQGSLPAFLGGLNKRTRTPVVATIIVACSVLLFAYAGSLGNLASITSMLLLVVFTLVNLALLRIKTRGPGPEGAPDYPRIIPLLGAILSFGMVVWKLADVIF